MALIDVSEITALTDLFGQAEASLQDAANPATVGSAGEGLHDARDQVYDAGGSLDDDDFDNVLTLATTLRTAERDLSDTILASLAAVPPALDAYFSSQVGETMRSYYDGTSSPKTVGWDTNFRSLWRRVQNEELVIALSSATKGSGTWAVTYDADGIELDTRLELRPSTLIGGTDVVVTLTLTKASGATAVVGVNIPAGTAAGTAFAVSHSSGSTFNGVTTMTVTGGTNGDVVKLWVSV